MQLPPNPLVIERRVAFSETDAAGLVHFTNYFKYMEAAEAELFRALGLPLMQSGDGLMAGFPRVDCRCRFKRPLAFDECVRIELTITDLIENRIHYSCTLFDARGQKCASGAMTTARVRRTPDGGLQSIPLDGTFRERLETWKNSRR